MSILYKLGLDLFIFLISAVEDDARILLTLFCRRWTHGSKTYSVYPLQQKVPRGFTLNRRNLFCAIYCG